MTPLGSLVVEIEGTVERELTLTPNMRLRIGRSPDSELVLPRPYISKNHAELTVTPQGVFITDVGSSMGTTVSGQSLARHQPTRIAPGTVIELGAIRLFWKPPVSRPGPVDPDATFNTPTPEVEEQPTPVPGLRVEPRPTAASSTPQPVVPPMGGSAASTSPIGRAPTGAVSPSGAAGVAPPPTRPVVPPAGGNATASGSSASQLPQGSAGTPVGTSSHAGVSSTGAASTGAASTGAASTGGTPTQPVRVESLMTPPRPPTPPTSASTGTPAASAASAGASAASAGVPVTGGTPSGIAGASSGAGRISLNPQPSEVVPSSTSGALQVESLLGGSRAPTGEQVVQDPLAASVQRRPEPSRADGAARGVNLAEETLRPLNITPSELPPARVVTPPVPPPPPSSSGSSGWSRRPTFPSLPTHEVRSRYLKYLPIIYQEQDFLARFLLIFESMWEPLERRQDHVPFYFDPHTAPAEFLGWLASWLAISYNERWPEKRKRRLLAEAMDLYRWRGTCYGLRRMIEVCTELTPVITENPKEPFLFRVRLYIPHDSEITPELVEELIRLHKPAHAGYHLELLR
ncbi:MAG: phage tail protein I [Myxococcota bacterium]